LYQNQGNVKLSKSALETLSIVAYKQPITRGDIDAIRGVSSYLKSLLEKNLIETKGRQEGPGRPLLYGTSSHFLEYFGLNSLQDLPKLKEIEEIMNVEIEDGDEEEYDGNPSE
ncbi:MAG: SMC-Scp complex subunit ScpB, partial [Candidatus Marinimicrobia bacterium]|nr:SMC-Scp complex subunit ScpB [Candidatus Neomarinimicrobiota bacterium]